ncbi:hypothetical protein MRX96_028290 [Rhipicephalus microplus]
MSCSLLTANLTGYTRRQVKFLIPGVCAVNKVERYDDTFPPNYELLVKDSMLDGPPRICLKRHGSTHAAPSGNTATSELSSSGHRPRRKPH